MLLRGLLFLTLCLCSVAAGAAIYLESLWLDQVGRGSSLAGNLPAFLLLALTPPAVYVSIALLGRRHFAVLLASCVCAALAAGLWLLAALVPVAEVHDRGLEVGLRGFCVALPHCILAVVLGLVVLATKPWRSAGPGATEDRTRQ
jgi:hypothetical protein